MRSWEKVKVNLMIPVERTFDSRETRSQEAVERSASKGIRRWRPDYWHGTWTWGWQWLSQWKQRQLRPLLIFFERRRKRLEILMIYISFTSLTMTDLCCEKKEKARDSSTKHSPSAVGRCNLDNFVSCQILLFGCLAYLVDICCACLIFYGHYLIRLKKCIWSRFIEDKCNLD